MDASASDHQPFAIVFAVGQYVRDTEIRTGYGYGYGFGTRFSGT